MRVRELEKYHFSDQYGYFYMNGHSEVSFVPTDDICVIHLHQNGIGVENVALKVNQVDVKISDFTINAEYEYLSVRAPKFLFFRSIFPIVLT